MKKSQKLIKVIECVTYYPRGWLRKVILGEEDERAGAIKKTLFFSVVTVFVSTLLYGVLKSGAEPLGDIKLAERRIEEESPSPYKAEPYKEHFNSTVRVKNQKVTRYVGLESFQRPLATIPSGLMVKARLVTGASEGPVEARIIEDGKVNGITVVRSGSHLFGVTNASRSGEKLVIKFSKLKNGSDVEEIQAQAYDLEDKTIGLRGSRLSQEIKKFAYTGGLNFVAGLADGLQDSSVTNGIATKNSTLKNGLLNGAKAAALGQSQELIAEMHNQTPTLEVSTGTVFYVGFE